MSLDFCLSWGKVSFREENPEYSFSLITTLFAFMAARPSEQPFVSGPIVSLSPALWRDGGRRAGFSYIAHRID